VPVVKYGADLAADHREHSWPGIFVGGSPSASSVVVSCPDSSSVGTPKQAKSCCSFAAFRVAERESSIPRARQKIGSWPGSKFEKLQGPTPMSGVSFWSFS